MKRLAFACALMFLHASQQVPVLATEPTQIIPNPALELVQLSPNLPLIEQSAFRQVNGLLHIYDQPNGTIIHTRPDGVDFVSVLETVDGWTQINPGEWIRSDQLSAAPISHLTGFFIPDEIPNPIGWLREDVLTSAVPGGAADGESLPRYRMIYAYEQAATFGQRWVRVGPDQWVDRAHIALVQPVEPHNAIINSPRWIGVDLDEQVMIAYEGDTPVFAALVATGIQETPTAQGLFRIYERHDNWTMDSLPGEPYYLVEDVPNTMFFNRNMAIHGAYWHDEFGAVRSHGCINMTVSDAAWLFDWLTTDAEFEAADIYSRPVVFVYRPSITAG